MTDKGLVIGVGHGLRGDDGAGLAVAAWLTERIPKEVALVQREGGDGANLIDHWQGFDRVVLIDAARSGAAPGTVHRFQVHETALPLGVFRFSSHYFSVAEAVELARTLGRLPKTFIIYGIEGAVFGYGEGLSAPVAAAVEPVGRQVLAEFNCSGPAAKLTGYTPSPPSSMDANLRVPPFEKGR